MKKPELDSILNKARLPEISEESLEMFHAGLSPALSATSHPSVHRKMFHRCCRVWRWLSGWLHALSSFLPSVRSMAGIKRERFPQMTPWQT